MAMGFRAGFVDRIEELALMEEALASAAARSPRGVVLAGEAGVGKSRLVTEFSTRAERSGARILAGSCFKLSGGGLPYGPIIEALRGLIRSLDTAARGELFGPAQHELMRLLPIDEEYREEVNEAVVTGLAQARLFELLLHLLDRLSKSSPLVLVVEDLHWADRSTLDLLTFLALRHEAWSDALPTVT
jgi:predicted ATPase